MNRRAFLTGLIAAPLVVRTAGLLMPVKVIEPGNTVIWRTLYNNRTLRVWIDPQSIRDRNVLLQVADFDDGFEQVVAQRFLFQDTGIGSVQFTGYQFVSEETHANPRS